VWLNKLASFGAKVSMFSQGDEAALVPIEQLEYHAWTSVQEHVLPFFDHIAADESNGTSILDLYGATIIEDVFKNVQYFIEAVNGMVTSSKSVKNEIQTSTAVSPRRKNSKKSEQNQQQQQAPVEDIIPLPVSPNLSESDKLVSFQLSIAGIRSELHLSRIINALKLLRKHKSKCILLQQFIDIIAHILFCHRIKQGSNECHCHQL